MSFVSHKRTPLALKIIYTVLVVACIIVTLSVTSHMGWRGFHHVYYSMYEWLIYDYGSFGSLLCFIFVFSGIVGTVFSWLNHKFLPLISSIAMVVVFVISIFDVSDITGGTAATITLLTEILALGIHEIALTR